MSLWLIGIPIYLFLIKPYLNRGIKPYTPKLSKTFLFLSALVWPVALSIDIVFFKEIKRLKEEITGGPAYFS